VSCEGASWAACGQGKRITVTDATQLILVDAKPSVRKQIVRELQIMNDCASPYIVSYYGCFPVDVHVGIVMEFMDLG
jgi:mitogen-activated protein kinase kinase